MRLRTDSWWDAGAKRAVLHRARPDPRLDPATKWFGPFLEFIEHGEEAKPGDVWLARRSGDVWLARRSGGTSEWTGFALTCPRETCPEGVHVWDHAWNCQRKFDAAHPSCWTWTGSPEAGDLTASPSLHVLAEKGGCGWHGWLRNGVMTSA